MHTKTKTLLAIGVLLLPISLAVGAQTDDTIAGLGAEVTLEEFAGENVSVYPPFGNSLEKTVNGEGRIELSGSETEVAGVYEVVATDSEGVEHSSSFTVLPDTVDITKSSIQSEKTILTGNGFDETTVQVILRDRFGNVLPARPVELISSRAADRITPLSSETDESGTQEFSVRTSDAGSFSLRAVDLLSGKVLSSELLLESRSDIGIGGYGNNNLYGPAAGNRSSNGGLYGPGARGRQTSSYRAPQNNAANLQNALLGQLLQQALLGQVQSFDVVSSFEIEAPMEMNVNQDATIRIRAIDQNGRKVEDYTGMVLLASTDPTALLPLNGEIQFSPQNLGEKTLTLGLRFRTPGTHILHVADSVDSNVQAEIMINVIGDEEPFDPTILITSHEDGGNISSRTITVEGIGAPFVNLIVSGGLDDVPTETDEEGNFSAKISFNPVETEYSFRVRDESGRFDSGTIAVNLDNEPPEITTVTFDPINPEAGSPVTVTVASEETLASMTVKIGSESFGLTEDINAPGTYSGQFPAPGVGQHQPIVKASDSAGNETEIRNTLVVEAASLPQVKNVVATPNIDSVDLTWSPSTDPNVKAYRIYVGESANNFHFNLDTDRATTSASVAGLDTGVMYYFAVTALDGDRESAEKSTVISAQSLGATANVIPQDSALMIEWDSPVQGQELSNYILDYGVEPNAYSEQRMVDGNANNYTLRNLINQVTYYVRVVPVTIEGEVLSELAIEETGTPVGPGTFDPEPAQPVPDDLIPDTPIVEDPIIENPHAGAPGIPPNYYTGPVPPAGMKGIPQNTKTGIPVPVWVFAIAIAAVVFTRFWYKRKYTHMQTARTHDGTLIDIQRL